MPRSVIYSVWIRVFGTEVSKDIFPKVTSTNCIWFVGFPVRVPLTFSRTVKIIWKFRISLRIFNKLKTCKSIRGLMFSSICLGAVGSQRFYNKYSSRLWIIDDMINYKIIYFYTELFHFNNVLFRNWNLFIIDICISILVMIYIVIVINYLSGLQYFKLIIIHFVANTMYWI